MYTKLACCYSCFQSGTTFITLLLEIILIDYLHFSCPMYKVSGLMHNYVIGFPFYIVYAKFSLNFVITTFIILFCLPPFLPLAFPRLGRKNIVAISFRADLFLLIGAFAFFSSFLLSRVVYQCREFSSYLRNQLPILFTFIR